MQLSANPISTYNMLVLANYQNCKIKHLPSRKLGEKTYGTKLGKYIVNTKFISLNFYLFYTHHCVVHIITNCFLYYYLFK